MASSVPPQQPAGQSQRPSPSRQDSRHSISERRLSMDAQRADLSQSTTSLDSETVLLGSKTLASSTAAAAAAAEEEEEDGGTREQRANQLAAEDEPRKCWICFADETEDTPTSSVWRSPCPCALTAHESCLLDWVADLEAPAARKKQRKVITCPQCRSEIKIARPRSLVVSGVSAVDRAFGKLVAPSLVLTLLGGVFSGCFFHGTFSTFVVFGARDFDRLMGLDTGVISRQLVLGMPLIPIALVLSRTTLADNVLPLLPVVFLASNLDILRDGLPRAVRPWRPTAAMVFAALPYVRGVYNVAYHRLFAEREKRWLKEVQPRAGDGGEAEGDAGQMQGGGDEPVVFELNAQIDIFDQGDEARAAPAHPNRQPDADGQAEGQQQQPVGAENNAANRANGLVVSASRVADTVIGALCFPVIASIMGSLLKVGLPKAWTSLTSRRRPGILPRSKWGWSIMGGCLFVVMKDTLVLYSRYRLAQDHKKRRILDYDGSKARPKRI